MADLPSDSAIAEALFAAGSAHHEYEQTALKACATSSGQASMPPSSWAGSAISRRRAGWQPYSKRSTRRRTGQRPRQSTWRPRCARNRTRWRQPSPTSQTADASRSKPTGPSWALPSTGADCQAGLADPTYPGQRDQPMSFHRGVQLGDLRLTPDEARGLRPQIPRTRIQRPQRRKIRLQARRSDLKYSDRGGQIPQPPRPQIHQINSAEQTRRRLGQKDLTAMPGGHHPRSTIEHRTEVIRPPQLGFAGRNPHPHRQLQPQLRGHRGINRGSG